MPGQGVRSSLQHGAGEREGNVDGDPKGQCQRDTPTRQLDPVLPLMERDTRQGRRGAASVAVFGPD